MSFTINANAITLVTLPRNPKRVTMKKQVSRTDIDIPGTDPLILSKGIKAKVMTWTGVIREHGKSLVTLETDYITDLELIEHTVVTTSTPLTKYSGTWIMTAFTYDVDASYGSAYKYIMEFSKGSQLVVL